jgi:hypothetical protein
VEENSFHRFGKDLPRRVFLSLPAIALPGGVVRPGSTVLFTNRMEVLSRTGKNSLVV